MSTPKITIGLCTGGTIRTETVVSLISNIYNLGAEGIQVNVLAQIGGYVDLNRNKIVDTALAQGTSHLMFIDADMIFPDDGIKKLLDANKNIIGANYNARLEPGSKDVSGPTVKMLVNGQPVSMIKQDFPTEIFKCYAVATGFMMIKATAFKKLKKPYFEAWQDEKGRHHTEDIEFCERANSAGIQIWCDPSIKVGHIGTTVY